MIYWDTSALLATLILEPDGERVIEYVSTLPMMRAFTSVFTYLEAESALQRRAREKSLSMKEADAVRLTLVDFRRNTFTIVADENVLDTGLLLQKLYELRPGDALQLASARVGADLPRQVRFLSLDRRLSETARREGLDVPLIS